MLSWWGYFQFIDFVLMRLILLCKIFFETPVRTTLPVLHINSISVKSSKKFVMARFLTKRPWQTLAVKQRDCRQYIGRGSRQDNAIGQTLSVHGPSIFLSCNAVFPGKDQQLLTWWKIEKIYVWSCISFVSKYEWGMKVFIV